MTLLRDNWKNDYPLQHLEGLPDFVEVTIGKYEQENFRQQE